MADAGNSRVTELDWHIAGQLRKLRLDEKGEAKVRLLLVSGALGMSYQSYTKLEVGRTSFRASHLHALSQFFGVPVTYFFEDAPAPSGANQEEIGIVSAAMRSVDAHTARDCARAVLARKSASGA